MAHLQDLSSSAALKAITINGCIVVESEEDLRKREERRRQRKSRWGRPSETVVQFSAPAPKRSSIILPGDSSNSRLAVEFKSAPSLQMPTMINASAMDETSQQIYLLQMQIQEASMKLARPDLGIPVNPRDRSPSPEPIYNNQGIRINTRDDRVRHRLVNQRNSAITKLRQLDPTYQPPSAYKYRNAELEDRVIVPADEYPSINFMGLLLGPRGNFLEELKAKTKCNIVIRGKGSLKSGMTGIAKDGKKYDALDDPLHVYITGATAEDVKGAVTEVTELINMQIYNPDCEKAVSLRSKHMHELAVLNGTLKDIDMKCLNCGRLGHKTWQCDESSIFTASVICSACGGVGHVTSDCKQRRPGTVFTNVGEADPKTLDKEYHAFLTGLGGGDKGNGKSSSGGYVPPMGDLSSFSSSGLTRATAAPLLMLTNGSGAPGAASAHARAISAGQQSAGGMLQVMGKSIFGGKLTRLTAGFKSQGELELERQKKIDEHANRPVPLEWQVERYENHVNKQQEEYLQKLEHYVREQKQQPKVTAVPIFAPPPPPPCSGNSVDTLGDLPNIIGAPMGSFWKQ